MWLFTFPPSASQVPLAEGREYYILHLEDNQDDRLLVRRTLAADGLRCDFHYASDEATFRKYLRDESVDLILSDYTIPSYGGAAALALAREVMPECPFVFVSGTIGEERAVESLRLGAADFVLKDRLGRLAAAVRRVLAASAELQWRREMEEKLRQSEERFRTMAEAVPDIFWEMDASSEEYRYVNPSFAALFGLPVEALYEDRTVWRSLVEPDDLPAWDAAAETVRETGECRLSYTILPRNGTPRLLEERRYATGSDETGTRHIVGITSDVTQSRKLEAELVQAQKMEAMGLMASKVAHDFNNFLIVMSGHAQLLLGRKDIPSACQNSLQEIRTAAERSARITRQLLQFGRRLQPRFKRVEPTELVEGIRSTLCDLAGSHITLSVFHDPNTGPILADRGMAEQILVNLVVNARDAMPHGGHIEIRTEPVKLGHLLAGAPSGETGERFGRISVRDGGQGISEESLPRIFEPFYTTKSPDKGTGLGLATVANLMKEHHGWITVESEPGRGALFSLYFPLATGSPAAPAETTSGFR